MDYADELARTLRKEILKAEDDAVNRAARERQENRAIVAVIGVVALFIFAAGYGFCRALGG